MTQATKPSGRLVITDEPVYADAIPGYYSRKGPTDAGLAAQQTLSDLQQRTATLEKLNHNYTRLNELQALNAQQHTQWQNTQTELERTQQQTSQAQSALDALSETSYQMEGQHDLTGQTRHVGHETSEWSVACITPDVCRVGKRTIAFDSSATLGCKTQHSPNVKARGTPVYRVGDMSSGTQANAGKHVVSGTSGGKGYVKFNSGHDSVKVNGIPVVRHDNLVQINCNAAGIGGACGQVITQIKAPNSQAKKASEAAQAPAGKRTSPRLEQLKAEREALTADMWDLDYTDKWIRFDDAHDALDTAIDGIHGEEGTAYDYAAQVGRGIAGFGKDVVLGTAELLYEGVKLSPKLYRRLYGSNGQKLTQLDVAILEEEILLGNITSGTLGEGALEIGGAIVEPVTTPWKEGDKVEAITRGGAEVAAIVVAPGKVISKLKARKASQLGTDGVSIKSDGGGVVHGVDEAADTGTMRDGDVVPNKVGSATRIDYSRGFERDLSNFKPGYELIDGPLDDDLVMVSYHADVPLGEGRSAKWWTTTGQANAMSTIDDVHQGLALPHDWGVRDTVSVIKIPKGTSITAYKGQASSQLSETGELFKGEAIQYRFKEFDTSWIIDSKGLK